MNNGTAVSVKAGETIIKLYAPIRKGVEVCFNVGVNGGLTVDEQAMLERLLSGPAGIYPVTTQAGSVVELGPRMNFATPASSNAVAICHACGLNNVTRLEQSRRYQLDTDVGRDEFVAAHHDRMTECLYEEPLESFALDISPEPVRIIPVLEQGADALRVINAELGLGMDEHFITYYIEMFKRMERNPTDVECFQLGQSNSDHSRHGTFGAQWVIDGELMPETPFEIVKSTLAAHPKGSVIAFHDNSSAIRGFEVETIMPEHPGQPSRFVSRKVLLHPLLTAETHNFPSGVAPVPGAETGTGGRIRDTHATGRGSYPIAATAGYCVGDLNIPGYAIPGEQSGRAYPSTIRSPLEIFRGIAEGSIDYGNKYGEPVIAGFVRTGEIDLPDGRRGWIKPIMFTGGLGMIDDRQLEKEAPTPGMKIVQIGGPGLRIGMGGGAASSMHQGENKAELDFNAVQRGDAEMKQRVNRVIRAAMHLIRSIHDQGAGGPCNVVTEITSPAGGRIDIRAINVGDTTMSVLEIWGCEYQERDALLIDEDGLSEFMAICQREKVPCEVLGDITGDGRITVVDSTDGTKPVDMDLDDILANLPQKTYESERRERAFRPLELPQLDLAEHVRAVFALPSIGSKGYLTRQEDRSVTGLVVQQQCCGPLQLAVADCAVVAHSHFGTTGGATSIGEQPIKALVNPAAGARMAVAEAIANMAGTQIVGLDQVKCSLNWMGAPKLPHEGADMYDMAVAERDFIGAVGPAVDGGKDSMSMAAKVGDEWIVAPMQMVVSAYAAVPDISKVVTPDIKRPGRSNLLLVSLRDGPWRLGGSQLAWAHSQIGDESPDVDDPESLAAVFNELQCLVGEGRILAMHDISDGGLITTVTEMVLAGNCGAYIGLPSEQDTLAALFAEELGWVIECDPAESETLIEALSDLVSVVMYLGATSERSVLSVELRDGPEIEFSTGELRNWWEASSDALEALELPAEVAEEQLRNRERSGPQWSLSFEPEDSYAGQVPGLMGDIPNVAVLREEGSNGDLEMVSAFRAAGFDPYDVTMTDLLSGQATLDNFRGLVAVGGFSYGDVLGSAVGWASVIKEHSEISEMFDRFYHRTDTFSLGVCNGCQLFAQLGWVPCGDVVPSDQPVFVENLSQRFESRLVTVCIEESPSIMLQSMAGSTLGVWVAHGEGRLYSPEPEVFERLREEKLIPGYYVNDDNRPTEQYPFNPNGSPFGAMGLCSPDGRHLVMMPHPERLFRLWQFPWFPQGWDSLEASPWLRMFQNAYQWCNSTK